MKAISKQYKPMRNGRQLVEEYICEHGGCSHSEICRALNLRITTVSSALGTLQRAQIIEGRGKRGQIRYYMVELPETHLPAFGLSSGMTLFNRLLARVRE